MFSNYVKARHLGFELIPDSMKEAEKWILNEASGASSEYEKDILFYETAKIKGIFDLVKPRFKMNVSPKITFINEKNEILLRENEAGRFVVMDGTVERDDFGDMQAPVLVNIAIREAWKRGMGPILLEEKEKEKLEKTLTIMKGEKETWSTPTLLIPFSGDKEEAVQRIQKKEAGKYAWVKLSSAREEESKR